MLKERLGNVEKVRSKMKAEGIVAYLVPSEDEHQSVCKYIFSAAPYFLRNTPLLLFKGDLLSQV